MRKAITVAVLLAWFAILGTCQMWGCAPLQPSAHDCCPKHASPQLPCLHDLLGKAKAGAVLAHGEVLLPALLLSLPAISRFLPPVLAETRLPNLAGLYLRNRVLLI
jgi:hypothetical protein